MVLQLSLGAFRQAERPRGKVPSAEREQLSLGAFRQAETQRGKVPSAEREQLSPVLSGG